MQFSWRRLPFQYTTIGDYESKLMDFISRAFYEVLPDAGLEIREEQAYTSYRIAASMTHSKTFFAEAGAGAGKTYAYLIPAVCHARRTGKPVVVACATSVLQNQLADADGDANTLSRLLNLNIDARLAGDPRNYVCEINVDGLAYTARRRGLSRLRKWASESKKGERSEVPDVPDDLWALAAWEESMPCDTCKRRGFCRMIRAREHYRAATDLVVCSHDMFFRDLWTREERQSLDLMPLLPSYGAVVFDEGHHVPDVARDTAGHSISRVVLDRTLMQLLVAVGDAKDYLPYLVLSIHRTGRIMPLLWDALQKASTPSATGRWHVERTPGLEEAASALSHGLAELQDRIAMAEDLVPLETRERFYILQFRLDEASEGLRMLSDETTALWASAPDTQQPVLWMVPKRIDHLMKRHLFLQKVPVVFTSATLSSSSSFDYIKRVVGASDATSASAGTPFDFGRQEIVYMPASQPEDIVSHLVEVMRVVGGRTLILCNTERELSDLKADLVSRNLPWTLLWEGDADRAELIRRFRSDTSSVLAGVSFWEGIDVPGEALSCVAVPRLPFPADDPLLKARRAEASRDGLDPFAAVDMPEMGIRLKQGCGRLIRTATDLGVFALLDVSFWGTGHEAAVKSAIPNRSELTHDFSRVGEFLSQKRQEPVLVE